MRRLGGGNQAQLGQSQYLYGLERWTQMTVVDGIEGAAEDADHKELREMSALEIAAPITT